MVPEGVDFCEARHQGHGELLRLDLSLAQLGNLVGHLVDLLRDSKYCGCYIAVFVGSLVEALDLCHELLVVAVEVLDLLD